MLVGGVGSKCFLIPGLLVWTLAWVGGVGCWRGISKLRRCDRHPCEILQFIQCSFFAGGGSPEGINLLLQKQCVDKLIALKAIR